MQEVVWQAQDKDDSPLGFHWVRVQRGEQLGARQALGDVQRWVQVVQEDWESDWAVLVTVDEVQEAALRQQEVQEVADHSSRLPPDQAALARLAHHGAHYLQPQGHQGSPLRLGIAQRCR